MFVLYLRVRQEIIANGKTTIEKNTQMKLQKICNNIELNIIFFSLLLHIFWEGLHSYFYIFPDGLNVYPRFCWWCITGDVLITLGAFFFVSFIFKTRKWIVKPTKNQIMLFILAGVVYTMISEFIHVNIKGTWQYSEIMPVIPWINVGLTPIVQWIIVPLVLVFIIRKQLGLKHKI